MTEPTTTSRAGGGPSQIGRYPVSRRLGAGAFASVWLGRDPEFEVDVAIKVLADNWAVDDHIRERFVSEARFLRRVRDRRVVHVYDIGTLDDGRPYFVMEYLDAGTLEDLRRSALPPAEALQLCAEAARGLDVLHRHHLVHRDVTPGNLLLSRRPDGSLAVVVADLGVARSVLDSSAGAMIVGTPSYMAPEQASGGVVDHRADVYALCAVAYALLTGAPPFRVERVADLTARPADVGPPPLAKSLGAPATLDGLFTSGLATDPHLRPPSAAILADAFDQLAAEMQGQPPRERAAAEPQVPAYAPQVPPLPAPPAASPEPVRTGRSSAFYIAMTVLAILLFAAFLALVIGLSL
ncbi:MAG TPA: serine/threonine-protein kinase [Microlunatus sp.]|nr:serine/threonine-protein kinase [Microlunatus sp.]